MAWADSSDASFNDDILLLESKEAEALSRYLLLAPVISCNLRQATLKALGALSQVYKTERISSYFTEMFKEHSRKRQWLDTREHTFSQCQVDVTSASDFPFHVPPTEYFDNQFYIFSQDFPNSTDSTREAKVSLVTGGNREGHLRRS